MHLLKHFKYLKPTCSLFLIQILTSKKMFSMGSFEKQSKKKDKSESTKTKMKRPTVLLYWRREGLPTPGLLPGGFHEQRSLAGYSPWGCKELDTSERLTQPSFPENYVAFLISLLLFFFFPAEPPSFLSSSLTSSVLLFVHVYESK